MPLSKQQSRGGPVWPLGFVTVAAAGTPVCIMANVDANNVNSPATATYPVPNFPGAGAEYSPVFRGIGVQGYHPGANNNGMIPNSGFVYLLMAPAGGTGNRSDSGSMIKVIPPAGDFFFPAPIPGTDMFSPYFLYIDADVSGEGAVVVGYGGGNP